MRDKRLSRDDYQGEVIPPPGPYPRHEPEGKLLNDPIERYREPVTCLQCGKLEWFCFCAGEGENMNNPKCGWWNGNDDHEDGCECLPYRVIFFVSDHSHSIVQYPTYNAAVIGLADNFHCSTEVAEEKYGWMIQFRVERLI